MKDIVPFLTSIATILIAFLTFKLQLDMRKDKLRTRKLEYIKHASNVYYFLKDILNDKKKISLTEKEYMYDINYIKYKIINIEEYNLLKNIYTLYKEKDYINLNNILNININTIDEILSKLDKYLI